MKADLQVLRKVSKQNKKEICMKDQGTQSEKEDVVIIEQPSEVPTEVLDKSSEILPPNTPQVKADVARHCFLIRGCNQKKNGKQALT